MIIEFIGPPRSGKSTQIKELDSYLSSIGKKVCIIEDRIIEKDVHVDVKDALLYNVLFFNKILETLVNERQGSEPDVIILDRGFYDAYAWFETELENKALSQEQVDVCTRFYEQFLPMIDKVIFIDIDSETSLGRHKKTGVSGTTDEYVMDKAYLSKMNKAYRKLLRRYGKKIISLDGKASVTELKEKIRTIFD